MVGFALFQGTWQNATRGQNDTQGQHDTQGQVENKPSAQQFEVWIAELGADDYSKRQFATIQLNRHKVEAIPHAILAMEKANGEIADRLFQFLSSIAVDPYSEDGQLAYSAVVNIARPRTTSKAIRAQKILQAIRDEQRDAAIERLRDFKIEVQDRWFQVISTRTLLRDALVIDSSFAGTAADLECLRWLTDVEFVRLEGPTISREILKQVVRISNLKKLQLVETQLNASDLEVLSDAPDLDLLEIVYAPIGDEAVEVLSKSPIWLKMNLFGTKVSLGGERELRANMDGVEVIVARGGFLGVQCQQTSAVIDQVVPDGAAERAGIRRGDRILRINTSPVVVFEDLRRELAHFGPGEEVSIEIERTKLVYAFEEPEASDESKAPLGGDERRLLELPRQRRIKQEKEKFRIPVVLQKRQEMSRDR